QVHPPAVISFCDRRIRQNKYVGDWSKSISRIEDFGFFIRHLLTLKIGKAWLRQTKSAQTANRQALQDSSSANHQRRRPPKRRSEKVLIRTITLAGLSRFSCVHTCLRPRLQCASLHSAEI